MKTEKRSPINKHTLVPSCNGKRVQKNYRDALNDVYDEHNISLFMFRS